MKGAGDTRYAFATKAALQSQAVIMEQQPLPLLTCWEELREHRGYSAAMACGSPRACAQAGVRCMSLAHTTLQSQEGQMIGKFGGLCLPEPASRVGQQEMTRRQCGLIQEFS